MAKRVAMGVVVQACRRRVDMKNNQARTDPDFKALISEQYSDVHGVVAGAGYRYFETSLTFPVNGSETYLEPSDFLSSVRAARVLPDGREIPLEELMAQEEWGYKGRTGDAIGFTHIDDRIRLYPSPSSGNYKLYYIPQAPDLSNYGDSDQIDFVTGDGLAFAIWGVAVKVHGELEGNALLAIQERDRYEKKLAEWASLKAFNEPRRTPHEEAQFSRFWRDGEWWPR